MQELWAAVLIQAVIDATGRASVNRKEYRNDDPQLEARQWIEEGGPDFQAVCYAAGVDPDAVRERVLSGDVGPIYLSSSPTRTKRRRAA